MIFDQITTTSLSFFIFIFSFSLTFLFFIHFFLLFDLTNVIYLLLSTLMSLLLFFSTDIIFIHSFNIPIIKYIRSTENTIMNAYTTDCRHNYKIYYNSVYNEFFMNSNRLNMHNNKLVKHSLMNYIQLMKDLYLI